MSCPSSKSGDRFVCTVEVPKTQLMSRTGNQKRKRKHNRNEQRNTQTTWLTTLQAHTTHSCSGSGASHRCLMTLTSAVSSSASVLISDPSTTLSLPSAESERPVLPPPPSAGFANRSTYLLNFWAFNAAGLSTSSGSESSSSMVTRQSILYCKCSFCQLISLTVLHSKTYNVHFEAILLVENALSFPLIRHLPVKCLVRISTESSGAATPLLRCKQLYTIQCGSFCDTILQLANSIGDNLKMNKCEKFSLLWFKRKGFQKKQISTF